MANRLAGETSPYLLQHAANPVDWYPWGDEALARARTENRPILLSLGYSTCHWCHVMAHESFEDPATAEVMNRLFINIKVDREERPDLDHIYQLAHQLLTGRAGGWPLNVFLTPEGMPFFAGTYFPPAPRHGMPAFTALLEGVARAWREQGDQIAGQNAALAEALAATLPQGGAAADLDEAPIRRAREALARQFDAVNGGFGGAPKFPRPPDLALLLASDRADDRKMALFTLDRMAEGGILDHLGGGFYRYSVDAQWAIPHFEKMLYDNAQLLPLYAEAWALTGEPRYLKVAEAVAAWVLTDMAAPGGGFYSALDADSEGEEGKYYLWSREEAKAVLDPGEYAAFAQRYGLDRAPNCEGRWHLRVAGEADDPALLSAARQKMLAARRKRIPPGRDDKILAAWNGLMAAGLLRAARRCWRPDWAAAGRACLDFVRTALWRDGRLRATWKDGHARLDAYLDDHAFLLAACIESLQLDWRPADLAWARQLAAVLLERFQDREGGGFLFTAHDHEPLVHRPKIGFDNATPSGNGVAALALLQLARVTGDADYARAAEGTLAAFAPALAEQPSAYPALLLALGQWRSPPPFIVLRGPYEQVRAWHQPLARVLPAAALVLPVANGAEDMPPPVGHPESQQVNAWVCEGVKCLPPVERLEVLLERFAAG